jgi:hypothetical protein
MQGNQSICGEAMPANTKSTPESTPASTAESKTNPLTASYDTPWKIAVEQHFEKFMAFYFPLAHAQIDWTVKHEFLDKELQAITKDALVGTRHVDKLVKVRRLSGQEDWICIHIEVQVAREPKFAQRMFVYNYRIFDRYVRPVVSMAVLGDDAPDWLPQQFGYAAMGCEMAFRFPIAKLSDFAMQDAALEAHPNPFALLTLAYLQNRATRKDMKARFEVKCKLVRMLHKRKWEATLIREFFMVIDWMMVLPPEFALQLSYFITALREEQKMEYVSSVERIWMEQKLHQGIQQGESATSCRLLCRLLSKRFGDLPQWAQERVKSAPTAQVEAWFDRAVDAATLDEVFQDLAH